MRLRILLLFCIFIIISCQKNDYELIYNQEFLKISDCKNIKLVNWILLNETGLKINQNIEIIVTDYYGGIPLQIENLPIYYKVKINENQYKNYKDKLLNGIFFDSWRFCEENDTLDFLRVNKFELSCTIDTNIILFGFRNVEGIMP